MKKWSIRILLAIAWTSLPLAAEAQFAPPPSGYGMAGYGNYMAGYGGVAPCQYEGDCGDACGDSIDCCCSCPSWEFYGGAVLLQRERPSNTTFLADINGDLFNMRQFEFDYTPGVDLSAVRHNGCGQGIEFRYLGLWDVDDEIVTGPITARQIAFGTNPPTFAVLPATTLLITGYDSQLNGAEANYRWCHCDKLTLLAGVRYINLDEAFDADLAFVGGGLAHIDMDTNNQLFGVQAGGIADIWHDSCNRFALGGFAKAGLYANFAEHEMTYGQTAIGAAPAFVVTNSDDDTAASFVAEGGLNFTYHVTCNISVQAGYQVLWLAGVALASEQIAQSGNVFLAEAGLDTDGKVLYHGATAGLSLCY